MKLCSACQTNYDDDRLTFCPRDGEVLQESPDALVGRRLDGKYEIESFIAQGGMGAVYLARHLLLGDRVVIKTLRSEMRTNAEWLRRFQREGKAARAFRHPNSVTVYDLSAGADGLVYMVMEYVEGHTLDAELKRRGRLTPVEALEVLEPVADVLDAAHAAGVVHRDLKPENVMLGRDDRGAWFVKVLDLGIAKLVGADDAHAAATTSLTVAGQILGTPYYMSPEQWGELPRDGRPEVDGRTDIYSLGIICFELVAGRKPLGGSTIAELRHKHVAVPLPALEEVAPGVPAGFGRAVARATAKDRADRPQTAGEFLDELRAALGPATSRGLDSRAMASGEAETAGRQPRTDGLEQGRAGSVLTADLGPPAAGPDTSRGGARETAAAGGPETGAQVDAGAEAGESVGTYATRPAAARTPEAGPRRSLTPLWLGGALALLLLAGVGGWLAWKRSKGRAEERAGPALNMVADAPAPRVEALSYWVETFDGVRDTTGERVAELSAALSEGQNFRLHFRPRARGYLYLVGPADEGNALVTMLTARGVGKLRSNLLMGGDDFTYPPADLRLALVGKGAATEGYTVIYSPQPLLSPAFLAEPALRELSPAEVKELEDLRARHRGGAPTLAPRADGGEARVAVEVPGPADSQAAPVIFDIRLRRR